MIICVAINAVPYGYDAILFGFHTQFFFLNAFSFGSLWSWPGARPGRRDGGRRPRRPRRISQHGFWSSHQALQLRPISCKRHAADEATFGKRSDWRPSAR